MGDRKWYGESGVRRTRKLGESVFFLTHGCGCKTGCITARCKCVNLDSYVDLDAHALKVRDPKEGTTEGNGP